MQEQNGTPITPQGPQPARGPAGYVSRETNYFSAARPAEPSMADAAEAAQRIVQPTVPAPTQPAVVAPVPVSPATSFDFLPSNQPVVPTPAPQAPVQSAPASPQPPVSPFLTPVAAAPTPPRTVLPTDLPSVVIPDVPSPEPTSKLKLTSRKAIMSAAVLVLVVSAGFGYIGLRHSEADDAQVKGVFRSSSVKQDSEGGLGLDAQPNEDGNAPSVQYYRTASSYPRVLRIPKTNTETRILALSISPTGALKSPSTIFDAGWYKDSAKPGEDGAMVIDGHETGPTKPGVFSSLGKLTKGDKLEVERGDGKKFVYTVKEVKVFEADKLDMSSVMVPYVVGKQGLNLITSAGKFNADTNKFAPRTVVYAVL